MTVVADASFLIDVDRSHPGALAILDRLEEAGEGLVLPSVVVAEVLTGAKDPRRALERLERGATILDYTKEDASEAARLARRALQAGRFPGWNDALIAGFASRRGLTIVTRNPKHFLGISTRAY